MHYRSRNLTSFMSSSICAYVQNFHFQVNGPHVQKHNSILHLQMYRLQVQKSFALKNKSNFDSIESFYFGQSFLCLQSFIDLLLILIIIIKYFIDCYIMCKYIINVDFILVPSYLICHEISLFSLISST